MAVTLLPLSSGITLRHLAAQPSNWFHMLATAALAVQWLVARRGKLSTRVLAWLDLGGTAASATLFTAMSWPRPAAEWAASDTPFFVVVLSLTHILVLRGALVPSSGPRTLVVSLLAVLPLTLTVARRLALQVPSDELPRLLLLNLLWPVAALATATVTSHVIYGLRRQVREATQLGQYTLVERIGEGGMGVVYRAHHAMLRRPTAIKLLPHERSPEQQRRFEREVQLTAILKHPNTIAVYDYGRTPDGRFYYVMELVEGLDLERLVEQYGPQPPGRVVHLLIQAASALAEAHALGLIHRDIKPGNLLLSEQGGVADMVKVVDFGLVRELASSDEAAASRTDTITGTPLYLAPEAITSPDSVDGRADIYALGAVGYWLLSGKTVFEGESIIAICGQHLHTMPRPPSEKLGAPLPDDLESLVLQCLEKEREARPPDARSLVLALKQCRAASDWTEADAAAWWKRWRERKTLPPEPAKPSSSRPSTVAVDLRDRGRLADPSA